MKISQDACGMLVHDSLKYTGASYPLALANRPWVYEDDIIIPFITLKRQILFMQLSDPLFSKMFPPINGFHTPYR